MKKRLWMVISLSVLLIFGIGSASNAATLSISASPTTAGVGGTITVTVDVDDAANLAGAALTIGYDASLVSTAADVGGAVNSNFFAMVTDSANDSIKPMAANADDTTGKLMLSGAYVDQTTGDAAHTGAQTLFTVQFTADAEGTANFTLMQTQLLNADAGWGTDSNSDGTLDTAEAVPALMGVNPGWETTPEISDDFSEITATFPTSAAAVEISGTGTPGDTDADGDVDIFDLLAAIDRFGPVGTDPIAAIVDIDGSGTVDLFDLLAMIDLM